MVPAERRKVDGIEIIANPQRLPTQAPLRLNRFLDGLAIFQGEDRFEAPMREAMAQEKRKEIKIIAWPIENRICSTNPPPTLPEEPEIGKTCTRNVFLFSSSFFSYYSYTLTLITL